jgi:hypothetical protein
VKDETADWLTPMLDEADARHIDTSLTSALFRQACMPAAEAATPFLGWLSQHPIPGMRHSAIDWIRFGQLLRHELGWDDAYPAYPAGDAE